MSTVDEDTELATIEHLDFDVDCDVMLIVALRIFGVTVPIGGPTRCQNRAVAVLGCRNCGKRASTCAKHGLEVCGSPSSTCMSCKATGPGVALFEFTPMGGS